MLTTNSKRVSVIIVFATIAFHLTLNAQASRASGTSQCRVDGYVFDKRSGEPLSSVTVVILGTYTGSYTDNSGYFCVSKIRPGFYDLRVTAIGYATEMKDSILITDTTTTHVNFTLVSWCDSWCDSAKADLKKGIVRILLSGLVVGNYESPEGRKLTHKYGFEYLSSCTLYPDCAAAYNEVVDEYLEKRNGKDWYKRFEKQFRGLDTPDH